MDRFPPEIIKMIVERCDIEAKFNLLLTDHRFYWEAKRQLALKYEYYESGRIELKRWVNKIGGAVRVIGYHDGVLGVKEFEIWGKNNQKHRDGDKPACTNWHANGYRTYKRWYRNGKLHRENGPAVMCQYASGHISELESEWWFHGRRQCKQELTLDF